jgi:hypothetical protein
MTRRLWLRSCVLALTLVAFVGVNPTLAKHDCKCDYGTVVVDPGVFCKFKICFETVDGIYCDVLGPGSTYKFKCNDQIAISLIDCKGNHVYLQEGCDIAVPVGVNCCVQACLCRDADGCLLLKITPSPIDFCPC